LRYTNKAETNLYKAEDLYKQLIKARTVYACVPVSILSLGGEIHFYHLVNKSLQEINSIDAFFRSGLDLGMFAVIEEDVSGESIEEILDLLYIERVTTEDQRDVVGFLILITFPSEKSEYNHALTIFPRELMSLRVRKKLIKQKKYLVVDTSKAPIVGRAHVNDIANYLSKIKIFGAEVEIYQVFKKDE
jgi:hypothetical protein